MTERGDQQPAHEHPDDPGERVDDERKQINELSDLLVKHQWYEPILRAILVTEPEPATFSSIREHLREHAGRYPGDGGLSRELRKLRALRLVTRHVPEGRTKPVWTLSGSGKQVLDLRDWVTSHSRGPRPDQAGAFSIDADARPRLRTIWGRRPVAPAEEEQS